MKARTFAAGKWRDAVVHIVRTPRRASPEQIEQFAVVQQLLNPQA